MQNQIQYCQNVPNFYASLHEEKKDFEFLDLKLLSHGKPCLNHMAQTIAVPNLGKAHL